VINSDKIAIFVAYLTNKSRGTYLKERYEKIFSS
jgi:hypothetical protein